MPLFLTELHHVWREKSKAGKREEKKLIFKQQVCNSLQHLHQWDFLPWKHQQFHTWWFHFWSFQVHQSARAEPPPKHSKSLQTSTGFAPKNKDQGHQCTKIIVRNPDGVIPANLHYQKSGLSKILGCCSHNTKMREKRSLTPKLTLVVAEETLTDCSCWGFSCKCCMDREATAEITQV